MSDSNQPNAEYATLTAGRGFVELADWATVVMKGADRLSFLHNMCTNDINKLSPGDCCEAFCTDVKGKIVAQVLVLAGVDQLTLLSVPGQAEKIISHLDRYIIREDVQLADATKEHAWFVSVRGEALTDWTNREVVPHLTCGISGRFSVSMVGVAAADRDRARATMTESGLAECNLTAWEVMRVEDTWPLMGVDFDSSNLPQEVNRDQMAINFNKGCYLGQETIARIDALGHVNQKVVALQFASESVPPVGAELRLEDKVVGRVTSSCWSPRKKAALALAMVRRGANDEGAQLQSEYGEATVVTGA